MATTESPTATNIVEGIKFNHNSPRRIVTSLVSFNISLDTSLSRFAITDVSANFEMTRSEYMIVMTAVVTFKDSPPYKIDIWGRWSSNLNKLYSARQKFFYFKNDDRVSLYNASYYGEILLFGPPITGAVNTVSKFINQGDLLMVDVVEDETAIINPTTSNLADLKITTKDLDTVNACKALLATVSPVFNAMFCSKFKETDELHLECYSSDAVKKLVDFSVKRTYKPNESDYEFITLCNEYLITPIVDKWCRLMMTSLSHTNAVDVMLLARVLNSERLVSASKRCIKNNSSKITNLDLLDRDDLIDILTTK